MEEITIIVIDDHPIFRQGVVNALSFEPGFKVIGEASTGTDGLIQIETKKPMVAVVDINLPGVNGLQITHQVNVKKIPTRILLLTAYDDMDQMFHASLAGAAAYCAKDVDPNRLIEVIRIISTGKYMVDGKIFDQKEFDRWLEEQVTHTRSLYSEPGNPFHPLSDREMEVLSCVVRGMSNKEVALSLGISHQTVKNHVTSILRKFNVEDRTQAVVYALKHGWITLHEQNEPLQE
jgi:DNA-binding NarL/FixJ family response regulator